MQVNLLGFEWKIKGDRAKLVDVKDLFAHITSNHGTEIKHKGHNRLVYVGETPGYYTGLVLTAKDHVRFCELNRKGKGLQINVREATAGSSLIDFNFFVLNKQTSRGLYQYYKNSCWVTAFGTLCGSMLDDCCEAKMAAQIVAGGGAQTFKEKDLRAIRRKFDGYLESILLVREDDFKKIVSNMTKIKSFQFSMGSVLPEKESWFRPLKGVSQSIRHQVSFYKESTLQARRKAIFDVLGGDNKGHEKAKIDKAAVHGVDHDGLSRTIFLESNPDFFGSYDFDEVAGGMNIQPEDFHKSAFMSKLLMVADQHPRFLGAKTK